jgi:tetratricopeptide (TPR) repeat protein
VNFQSYGILPIQSATQPTGKEQFVKPTILLALFFTCQPGRSALASALAAETQGHPGQMVSKEAMKLNNRGLDHLKKKEYSEATRLFQEALKIEPDFPDALNNLGKALESSGKDDEAIADFDKALKLAPQDAAIHSNKGLALFHERKFEESIASYRKAIEIHSDFAEAQNGLAALFSLDRTDEAISAFRKVIHLDPKNSDALNNLGQH